MQVRRSVAERVCTLPPELRSRIYHFLQDDPLLKPERRVYEQAVGDDTSGYRREPLVKRLRVHYIYDGDFFDYFDNPVYSFECIAKEFIRETLPNDLFVVSSIEGLAIFIKKYLQWRWNKSAPCIHIEVPFMHEAWWNLYGDIEVPGDPHGRTGLAIVWAYKYLEELTKLEYFHAHIYLRFEKFWRDYEALRDVVLTHESWRLHNFAFAFDEKILGRSCPFLDYPDSKSDEEFHIEQTQHAIAYMQPEEKPWYMRLSRYSPLGRYGCRPLVD